MKYPSTLLLTALALSALPFTSSAQDTPAAPTPAVDGGGAPPERGGWNRGNMEQFRQRMIDRLKTQLKANDEEMTVIQPLVEKVFAKQREATGNRFGGGGPRPQRGGGDRPQGGGDEPNRGPRGGGGSPESQALQESLANDGASAADIQAKLTALREQRKKAAAELAAAREDLRKVLTARQEATLVLAGLLE